MKYGWRKGLCDYPPPRRLPGPRERSRMHLTVNPVRPTIAMIKEQATTESFKAGRDYFDRNMVVPLEVDRGLMHASIVDGETYHATASLGYGSGVSYCTCVHDGQDICKHVVAVLLYASKNFGQIIDSEESNKQQHSNKLGIRFNVRADIDDVYYQMGDAGLHGGEVDFNIYTDKAKIIADQGNYDEAIRRYREIVNAIYDNMENVDDSYAHYSTRMGMILDSMADCITRQALDHQQKRKHLSYLHRRMVLDNYGCDTMFEQARISICTDKEDRAYYNGLPS